MGNCLCAHAPGPSPKGVWKATEYQDLSMCARHSHLASSRSTNHSRSSTGQLAATLIPGTLELLGKAKEALSHGMFSAADAEIVCSLALAASGGHEALEVWCDDIAETRLGVCQMTLSMAQLLASQHGFMAFGAPTKASLLSFVPAMYYAAALIEHLSAFGGVRRGLCFSVKAFFAGPKVMNQDEQDDLMLAMSSEQLCDKSPQARLHLLWLNFKVASRHLVRVTNFEAQTEAELNPMHVVQNDETLSSIARACQVTGQELRKMNPDLPVNLQCGDCIALPRPCQPRLYCTRRGDTWASIANWLHMPPGKLRLHNADAVVVRHGSSILANLANSSMLLEGQLIEVPGLGNGSSVCSDDSRAEDLNADYPLSSPRFYNYTSLRQTPIVVGGMDRPLELRHGGSYEIMEAHLE
eukprot:jgi/Ulvmu1/5918/UM026_0040.1